MAGTELATGYYNLVPSMKGNEEKITAGLTESVGKASEKAGAHGGKTMGTHMAHHFRAFGAVAIGASIGAVAGLYKIGETFDEVADTIRVGTGASGEALDGLVQVAKNVGSTTPAEFKKIAPVVADLNTRLGLTGEDLETVAKQYLEAGRILGQDIDIQGTTAAFSAFGIEGKNVQGAMDNLFRASQATGVGMNELAKSATTVAPQMKQLGFSFEETVALAGKLDKAGLNSTAIMSGMGKGLVNLAKAGEDPQKAFKRVVGEIGSFVEKGKEADALKLAAKVFGTKGATQFVDAIKSGTLATGDMMESIGATSDTILGVGEETQDFAEKWQIVQNKVALALEPLGSAVFAWLGQTLGDLTPHLEAMAKWFSENTWAVGVLAGIVGSFLVAGFVAWAASIWAANAALLANPITWIIVGIGLLVAAIILLIQNWEAVAEWLTTVWAATCEWVKEGWEVLARFFGDLWNYIAEAFTNGWNAVAGSVSDGMAAVGQWFTDGWNAAVEGVTNFINSIVQFFTDMWNSIATAVTDGVNATVTFFVELPGKILAALAPIGELWTKFAEWFKGMFDQAVRWLGSIVQAAIEFPGKVFNALGNLAAGLVNLGLDAFDGLFRGSKQKILEVVRFVGEFPASIIRALGNMGNLLLDSGRALVDGFLNGIKGAWNKLTGWVKSGMEFLRGLWPFSPAKWGPFSGKGYVTYSGKAIVNDFADSITGEMPYLYSSVSGAMQGVNDLFNIGTGADSGSPAAYNSRGNVTVQSYSMDPHSTAVEVSRRLKGLI